MKFDREIKVITEFKSTLQQYIALDYKDRENSPLREKLNTLACEVENYVEKVGVATGFYIYQTYTPAFSNLFNISVKELQAVMDILGQAIGNYQYLQKEFKRKRFNPIYWIGEFIRIPFYLISFAGFGINKYEFSLLGKKYKLVISIVFFLAALVPILNYCDMHLSDIFNFFKSPPPPK